MKYNIKYILIFAGIADKRTLLGYNIGEWSHLFTLHYSTIFIVYLLKLCFDNHIFVYILINEVQNSSLFLE